MLDADQSMTEHPTAVVVGAGGIGSALCRFWHEECGYRVVAISRRPDSHATVDWRVTDYSEDSLRAIVESLQQQNVALDRLVITNGFLSRDGFSPERKMADLDAKKLEEVLAVNSILPAMVLKAFWPLLRASESPRIAVLSARVGSIEDNRLGGWYAYRASKAALNMLLRTASIELKRLNRRSKLIAYHPGTVDTALSKPFQRNVPSEQLLTPEFAARRLHEVLLEIDGAGELSYLDWRGDNIPW